MINAYIIDYPYKLNPGGGGLGVGGEVRSVDLDHTTTNPNCDQNESIYLTILWYFFNSLFKTQVVYMSIFQLYYAELLINIFHLFDMFKLELQIHFQFKIIYNYIYI